MAAEKPSIICVSNPLPIYGGGSLRALRSLKEYSKHFNTHLFFSHSLSKSRKEARKEVREIVKELMNSNIKVVGYIEHPNFIRKIRFFGEVTQLLFPATLRPHIGVGNFEAVVALHETIDAIYIGNAIGDLLEIPKIGLLQLPPFYSSKKRLRNILKASILWRHLLTDNTLIEKAFELEAIAEFTTIHKLSHIKFAKLLKRYNTLLAVSKAIPHEMGDEWTNKVVSLDPGVSLDEDDLSTIAGIRSRIKEKGSYIVFGGRPSANKGLADALIAFSFISKHYKDLKLVVTGYIRRNILSKVKRVCRKLDIEDKVIFTGFVPREKRFEIVARARLMLYPSHVDAFPYAVLESLHLGTPVVGYRIPALEIYYGGQPGVKLVEEGDLEALTIEAMNVLEKGVGAVEPPKIRGWREIMEEVAIIRKALRM